MDDGGLDGYVLHEPLGAGSAAVVWRAEPVGAPGRVVAVKRLRGPVDAAATADLRREAEALEALSHPSILRLLEVVPDGEGLALVLPYVPGGSLADRIAAAPGGLEPAVVADLGARLGGALAAAHNLGLVHRDVKPANVLYDAEGQPLLADFGTARLRHDRAEVAGTAEYLAPEVARGAPPDARSDVYGLGVSCYEALAGTPPYAGSTPAATLAAAARGRHVPLADLVDAPPGLVAAVEAAMARDPVDRPATASELAGRLDEARRALEASSGTALAPPTPGRGAGVLGSVPADHHPGGTSTPGPGRDEPDGVPAHAVERSGTRLFGPAPPPVEPARPERRRVDRRLLVAAAVVALLLPVAVVAWLVSGGDDGPVAAEGPDVEGADGIDGDEGVADRGLSPCDGVPEPEVADAEVLLADVEGRGCGVPVAWDGTELVVPRADADPHRYELDAHPEDQLLFGDWSCDGRETPALYRPTTGEAFVFEGFADDEEIRVEGDPTGVEDGRASARRDVEGCDVLEVHAD